MRVRTASQYSRSDSGEATNGVAAVIADTATKLRRERSIGIGERYRVANGATGVHLGYADSIDHLIFHGDVMICFDARSSLLHRVRTLRSN